MLSNGSTFNLLPLTAFGFQGFLCCFKGGNIAIEVWISMVHGDDGYCSYEIYSTKSERSESVLKMILTRIES